MAIVFAVNDEIVSLWTIIGQIEVFAEEAKQFWRWSVISILVSRQVFILQHELENAKTYTLSLKRLMDVKVKHATRLDLSHSTSSHEQTLVASFEKSQSLRALDNHIQILVSGRLNEL